MRIDLTAHSDEAREACGPYTPYSLNVIYLSPGAVGRGVWLMARQVQQLLTEQTAAYWLERSDAYLDALPTLDEYHGGPVEWETGKPITDGSDIEDRRAQWRACNAAADHCRVRAHLQTTDALLEEWAASMLGSEGITEEIWDVLTEVAA